MCLGVGTCRRLGGMEACNEVIPGRINLLARGASHVIGIDSSGRIGLEFGPQGRQARRDGIPGLGESRAFDVDACRRTIRRAHVPIGTRLAHEWLGVRGDAGAG